MKIYEYHKYCFRCSSPNPVVTPFLCTSIWSNVQFICLMCVSCMKRIYQAESPSFYSILELSNKEFEVYKMLQ
jgi:hypothetical protein